MVNPSPGGNATAASTDPTADGPNAPRAPRAGFLFLGTVTAVALLLDAATKAWIEIKMSSGWFVALVPNTLFLRLAYNPGGAWSLMRQTDTAIRTPFFVCVSVLATAFIVSLYSRIAPTQRALKWGLPLVLGGALGNLVDRLVRGQVVDFVEYHGTWVTAVNEFIQRMYKSWIVTDQWPTFNVADVWICIGVGLMAVDMFTSSRRIARERVPEPDHGSGSAA
jgi:lipoprotein signal peptidase